MIGFGPTQPEGGKRIQTRSNKRFFPMLPLLSPLEPFFTQKWRPSEIALVK
ncbi:MAG: hypothetical protein AW11_02699 [Candidatus Accumulibacter regalis]|jgi:hypothetical protein|uniref:Uncharacterized protein n=1 Tax=Accumulibacter regalis TaxID=522306 RepID=A0A011QD95_ACCRE|nr:MAG: hypothetical protein AW11_02699 [Candidatus Accumulibacter regalis]